MFDDEGELVVDDSITGAQLYALTEEFRELQEERDYTVGQLKDEIEQLKHRNATYETELEESQQELEQAQQELADHQSHHHRLSTDHKALEYVVVGGHDSKFVSTALSPLRLLFFLQG